IHKVEDPLTLIQDQWDQLIHCREQAALGSRCNILSLGLMWPTCWALLSPKQIRCKMQRKRSCQRGKIREPFGPVIIRHWQLLIFIVLVLSIVERVRSCKHFYPK